MTTAAPTNTSAIAPTLATLATKANDEHRACLAAANSALEHARAAGDFLVQAKAQCQHGTWTTWLAHNFDASKRTAQAYMRVAKRWPEIEAKAQGSALLSVDKALELLGDPKPKKTVDGLPYFVAMFVDRGSLNGDHTRELLKLRDFFGVELTRQFGDVRQSWVESEEDATVGIYQLRPEEIVPLTRSTTTALEALREFLTYVSDNGKEIPQWEVAAFWWASFADSLELCAADLGRGIDGWKHRHLDALAWWHSFGREACGGPVNHWTALWWGYRGDLRQSGSLERAQNPKTSEDHVRIGRGLAQWCREGSYCYPSNVQRLLERYWNGEPLNDPEQAAIEGLELYNCI